MPIAMASQPRYPEISVEIESKNPLALVAAVREAMRLAHVQHAEISQFSDEALARDFPQGVKQTCAKWVCLEGKGRN